jgi:hypothetical protein
MRVVGSVEKRGRFPPTEMGGTRGIIMVALPWKMGVSAMKESFMSDVEDRRLLNWTRVELMREMLTGMVSKVSWK